MRWGGNKEGRRREKKISECEEKGTQTESSVVQTQENSSQVRDDEILVESDHLCELVEKDVQDQMMRGAVDKSVIYHELDFSMKNPILYCDNGGIIVRSKYTASKPPSSGRPSSSSSSSSPTSKQVRMNKAKSCGFDIVQGKICRPGEEVSPVKNGKSHQDLCPKKPESKAGTPMRTPAVSPKFKKNEKCSKKTSYHGFFKSKQRFSQQSLGCDWEKKDEDDDYMFLDFSKNVKERSRNRAMTICGKTSTL